MLHSSLAFRPPCISTRVQAHAREWDELRSGIQLFNSQPVRTWAIYYRNNNFNAFTSRALGGNAGWIVGFGRSTTPDFAPMYVPSAATGDVLPLPRPHASTLDVCEHDHECSGPHARRTNHQNGRALLLCPNQGFHMCIATHDAQERSAGTLAFEPPRLPTRGRVAGLVSLPSQVP